MRRRQFRSTLRAMSTSTAVSQEVPFVDLSPDHGPLKAAILDDIARLVDTGMFINGPQVAEFEEHFATYCGTDHCVGLASGLDALRLGLLAGGIEPGDEVILPANTFAATIEAVLQARATPVLVDATASDYNIDADAAADAVCEGTRFIMPVHLYGQLADMRRLMIICEASGIRLIEDACQAHGAQRDGVRAGGGGFASAFSFYPAKNLGAFGDAGALMTNDPTLAAKVRALREHGQLEKYRHAFEGYTSRLDTLQAIVLQHKLPLLDQWNEARRAARAFYDGVLNGAGDLVLPPQPEGSSPVWHLYVVRTRRREALGSFLAAKGIATGRHYPEPLHLSPAFAHLGYPKGAFPVTEALANEVLSLPIFPGITERQMTLVAEGIRAFFAHG
jgi:dTDP-4-amino-4,6-dideoxygalactose transaminase